MIPVLISIEFNRSLEDITYDYDRLSDNDKEKMGNISIITSFDYEDEYDNYTIIILILPNEKEKYKKILDDNIIPYICTDITQNVIRNKINLSKKLIKFVNNYNKIEYFNFINKVNEWIGNNIDIDIVLDIISEYGIESLRDIDKEFLKKV
jgi:hypothetical protein